MTVEICNYSSAYTVAEQSGSFIPERKLIRFRRMKDLFCLSDNSRTLQHFLIASCSCCYCCGNIQQPTSSEMNRTEPAQSLRLLNSLHPFSPWRHHHHWLRSHSANKCSSCLQHLTAISENSVAASAGLMPTEARGNYLPEAPYLRETKTYLHYMHASESTLDSGT